MIARSIREGIPPLEAAKTIRTLLGLNSPQSLAAMNYRAELKLQGLSEERVDKALEFYTARKVKERADTVARTEVIGALNAGSLTSWKQAQRKGLLPRNAKKKFITTPDEKLCPICKPMNKQEQPLAKPFITPKGDKIQFPPAHPRCRCTLGEPTLPSGRRIMSGELPSKYSWLEHGSVISRQKLNVSATSIYEVMLNAGGGQLPWAMFKPADEGHITQDIIYENFMEADASTAQRELLASALDRVLGLELIPPTGSRMITFGAKKLFGAIAEKIPNTLQVGAWTRGFLRQGFPFPQLTTEFRDGASIFDIINGNMDRHGGNMLVQLPEDIMKKIKAGTLGKSDFAAMSSPLNAWLIDHGYTFGLSEKRFAFPTAVRGDPNFGLKVGSPLGRPQLINANFLTKWWFDKPTDSKYFDEKEVRTKWGAAREITKDSADKWISILTDTRPQLLTLAQRFGLHVDELGAMEKRIHAVLNSLSLGKLRDLFIKMMVHP
jgi:hypothetical protein